MWLRRTKFSLALLPLLAGVILSIIAWLHRPDIWFARFSWPTRRFSAGISLQTVDVDWSNWSRAGYAANLESYTGLDEQASLDYEVASSDNAHAWCGFGCVRGDWRDPSFTEFWLPTWVFVSILTLPMILLGAQHWRRQKRPPGSCAKCGYDLRATPARCPECGAVPAK